MSHRHGLRARQFRSCRPLRIVATAGAALALGALAAAPAAASTHRRAPTHRHSSATLERGDRGAAVRQLQRALSVRADGIFGRGTERALRSFQRRHRLAVDGVAGPATLRALRLPARAASVRRKPRSSSTSSLSSTSSISSTPSTSSTSAQLQRIAQCESGDNPRAVSSSGTYRGEYQFDRATWRSVGGHGDPARASEHEQDRRAAILLRRSHGSAWPNCA